MDSKQPASHGLDHGRELTARHAPETRRASPAGYPILSLIPASFSAGMMPNGPEVSAAASGPARGRAVRRERISVSRRTRPVLMIRAASRPGGACGHEALGRQFRMRAEMVSRRQPQARTGQVVNVNPAAPRARPRRPPKHLCRLGRYRRHYVHRSFLGIRTELIRTASAILRRRSPDQDRRKPGLPALIARQILLHIAAADIGQLTYIGRRCPGRLGRSGPKPGRPH